MALVALLLCANFTSCSDDDGEVPPGGGSNIPANTIRYQTTSGSRLHLDDEDVFGGAKMIKHTYSADGYWTMEFDSNVTAIEENVFYEQYTLTSVTLPNSVASIGDKAFTQCSNLSNVTLGNGVKTIGLWAFANCAITSITIPNSVTTI